MTISSRASHSPAQIGCAGTLGTLGPRLLFLNSQQRWAATSHYEEGNPAIQLRFGFVVAALLTLIHVF